MITRWIAGFTAAMVVLATSGCATAVKVHPEFKTRHPGLHRVAAMPPDVAVYKLTFKGDKELMSDLIPPAVAYIHKEMEAVLTKKGYQIQQLDLSDAVLEQQPELRTALFSVRQMFVQTLKDIQKRKQKKFTYQLSPAEINQFADLAQADALVFLNCEAVRKSGGEITKDVAKSLIIAAASLGTLLVVFPSSFSLIHVAVVDGNTGDILWYNHNLGKPAGDIQKGKQIRAVVRNLFNPFPKASGFKKAKVKAVTIQPETASPAAVPDLTVPSPVVAPQPAAP